jgi:hypothetical protein
MRIQGLSLFLLVFLTAPVAASGEDGIQFFEKKIRPVLVDKCYKCHSAEEKIRGGLLLDTRDGLLTGGETGPAIVPDHADKSLLIKAIRYTDPDLQMPPNGKMPANVIADFEKWVAMGAPDPRTGKTNVAKSYGVSVEEGRKFWAFQPVKKSPLPAVKDKSWPRGSIDQFLMAKWDSKGLRPAADADKLTLIRRAYFDLIGLPPSPEQIDAFLSDDSPDAFATVIDKLLAMPQYGERWGRHWLDVARYAESSGGGRSLLFPDAWRYRDYVIHSFNVDKPYNRFVKDQISGDLMNSRDERERFWNIVATGFLMLGPINYEMQDKPVLEMDVVDEQIDTLGRTMMGMTIGCARCHDHKFDPIPTKDYYAMAGILKSTKSLVHNNVSKWVESPLPMLDPDQSAAIKKYETAVAELQAKIEKVRKELQVAGKLEASGVLPLAAIPGIVIDDTQAKKVGTWNPSTFQNTFVHEGYVYSGKGESTITFVPRIERDGTYEVRLAYLAHTNRATNTPVRVFYTDGDQTFTINQKQTPAIDGRWHSLGKFRFEKGDQWFVMVGTRGVNGSVVADAVQFIHEDDLEEKQPAKKPAVAKAEPKVDLKSLEAELKKLQAKAPTRPVAMSVTESDKVGNINIAIRGLVHNKGPVAERGFLQVATVGPMPKIPADQSGRLQLAEWVASPDNPLTARVMVNRVWYHLFGRGIVSSLDNFGSTGSTPSNPELLDHLATRFVEENWSVKKLIREIMLSRAYQMSSQINPKDAVTAANLKADTENTLFWHQNRQRLDAEAIRDTILLVSGRLDLTPGGPGMVTANVVEREFVFKDVRRSVYTPIFRNNLLELFQVFDFPDPNLLKGARSSSTVAPQALFLMNSPFVMEQASTAAKNGLANTKLTDPQRLDLAYRTTLGRLPNERERELALSFLSEVGEGGPQQQQAAWERFYQVLFASIDFRYVN